MSSDDRSSRERAVRVPHPATVARSRAAQPKLVKAATGHPANRSRVHAAAPKLAKEPTPHPATVTRSKKSSVKARAATQPSKANPGHATARRPSKAERSLENLKDYRPSWLTQNGITAQHLRDFGKVYAWGIRGHASGDNQQGEQKTTTDDCKAYKSWHTRLYGWK